MSLRPLIEKQSLYLSEVIPSLQKDPTQLELLTTLGDVIKNTLNAYKEILELTEESKDPVDTKTSVLTVGDIREAIEGREDEESVYSQIVAQDGTAWYMATVFAPVFNQPKGLVIDMRHPELKTLS